MTPVQETLPIDATTKKQIRDQLETIKYLSHSQLSNLLAQTRKYSTRDTAIFTLAYYHGLRISEVGRLQLQDYDSEINRIYIRRMKNGPKIQYKMAEEAVKVLRQWLKIRGSLPGALFPSRQSHLGSKIIKFDIELKSKGISKRQLDTLFRSYAKQAGIPEDLQHFHVLRHSCAVHMVEKGIGIREIADWLGHRNINSTMVYAAVSDKARNQTAERFYEAEKEKTEERLRKKEKKEKGVKWGKD